MWRKSFAAQRTGSSKRLKKLISKYFVGRKSPGGHCGIILLFSVAVSQGEISMAKTISSGTVHKVPPDLRQALSSDQAARAAWEDITPLARNEWICWTTSVKKAETRKSHVERTCSELKEGVRRPCCWPGCPHR
jgi:hypothetical protein